MTKKEENENVKRVNDLSTELIEFLKDKDYSISEKIAALVAANGVFTSVLTAQATAVMLAKTMAGIK